MISQDKIKPGLMYKVYDLNGTLLWIEMILRPQRDEYTKDPLMLTLWCNKEKYCDYDHDTCRTITRVSSDYNSKINNVDLIEI